MSIRVKTIPCETSDELNGPTPTPRDLVADFGSFMSDVIDSDGYRANVGIVLMHGAGEVFLGRRTGGKRLAVPSGGHASWGATRGRGVSRELHEEVGLHRSDVELIGRTAEWIRYRLPQKYVRRNRHPVCIGLKQRWVFAAIEAGERAVRVR